MRIAIILSAFVLTACTDAGSRCRKTANKYEKCLSQMTDGDADPNLSDACDALDGEQVDDEYLAFWNCSDDVITSFDCAAYGFVEGNIQLGADIVATCGDEWPW